MSTRSLVAVTLAILVFHVPARAEDETVLLNAMREEMERSFDKLKDAEEAPLYFLMYAVSEEKFYEFFTSPATTEKPGKTGV